MLPRRGPLAQGVYGAQCSHCGHIFKFRSVTTPRSQVTFKINGTDFTADESKWSICWQLLGVKTNLCLFKSNLLCWNFDWAYKLGMIWAVQWVKSIFLFHSNASKKFLKSFYQKFFTISYINVLQMSTCRKDFTVQSFKTDCPLVFLSHVAIGSSCFSHM